MQSHEAVAVAESFISSSAGRDVGMQTDTGVGFLLTPGPVHGIS